MDWTGGVRRRFAAGKNDSLLQKQKAHFAKARATLHSTQRSQGRYAPSFLQQRSPSQSHSRKKRPRSISASNDGFNNVAQPSVEHGLHQHHIANSPAAQGTVTQKPRNDNSLSVVYISSGQSSSSDTSAGAPKKGRKVQEGDKEPRADSNIVDEEQRLLLVNRRRLLARTDWLGLAASRPLRMSFGSTREKDRIGKRRKVEKSKSRKGETSRSHPVPPAFEQPFLAQNNTYEHIMRPEDIEVKIGTDALNTQTQPSRRCHTPERTSARRASTEFGSLSEEPMLLGEDGDLHESALWFDHPMDANHGDMHTATSMAVLQSGRAPEAVPNQAKYVDTNARCNSPLPNDNQRLIHSQRSSAYEPTRATDFDLEHSLRLVPAANMRIQPATNQELPGGSQHTIPVPERNYRGNIEGDGPWRPQVESENEDDDEMWKRILDIRQPSPTQHSIAALCSSTMHQDTSDSSIVRPVQGKPAGANDTTHEHTISMDIRQQQSVKLAIAQQVATGTTSDNISMLLQSPSASFKKIDRLARLPAPQPVEANDDALWRQFVIGSQESSDEPSDCIEPLIAIMDSDTVIAPTAPPLSAFSVSGLGTSNNSNMGDNSFVNNRILNRSAEINTEDANHGSSPEQGSMKTIDPSVFEDLANDIGDTDSIEDTEPVADDVPKPRNTHAPVARAQNPR